MSEVPFPRPPTPSELRSGGRRRRVRILFVCSLVGIVFLALLPTYYFRLERWIYQPSLTASCRSNVKQLAQGILLYASDYDDRLPLASEWMDAIEPKLRNDVVLQCPIVMKDHGPDTGFGYAFNSQVSGEPISKFASPEKILLVFDSKKLARSASDAGSSLDFVNPRHEAHGSGDGTTHGSIAARLDGSVVFAATPADLYGPAPTDP